MTSPFLLHAERELLRQEHIILAARECERALEIADTMATHCPASEATWRRSAAYWSDDAFREARA